MDNCSNLIRVVTSIHFKHSPHLDLLNPDCQGIAVMFVRLLSSWDLNLSTEQEDIIFILFFLSLRFVDLYDGLATYLVFWLIVVVHAWFVKRII